MMNIQEIKDFIKSTNLPKTVSLKDAETIIDVSKFFNTHLSVLQGDKNSRRIKKLHYYRIIKAIEIIKGDTNPNEKVKTKHEVDNEIKDVKVVDSGSALKPNTEFENEPPAPKPKSTSEAKKEVKEIKPKSEPKKESKPSSNDADAQMSLF